MSSPYFSDTLKSLIGYSIGIFSSDGTLVKGSLVNVKKDYLVLQNKKGEYFYYHLDQIKSISKNTKHLDKKPIQDDYLNAEKLQEILEHCKYKWITINCHNDQLIRGYLSKVFEDHIILISSEEKIIMQTSYISNIFPGFYEDSDSTAANDLNEKEAASPNQTEYVNNIQQAFHEEKPYENQLTNSETHSSPSLPNESGTQPQFYEEKTIENQLTNPETHSSPSLPNESGTQPQFHEEKTIENQLADSETHSNLSLPSESDTQLQLHEDAEFLLISRQDIQQAKNKERPVEKQMTYNENNSLEKTQQNDHPIVEKTAEPIDYNLFDQKRQSRPSTGSGSLSASHEYEEKNEPTENNKILNNDSTMSSHSKKRFFRKKGSKKKLKINRREMKSSPTEEQQIGKQTTLLPAGKESRVHIKPILTPEERDKVLESQYYSLMKQAEKNYMNLKKKRLARENLR
ncbi:DUF2642 domain-containing protein [Pseudobacillus sp. 179-B 2D1 NHS]